MSKKRPDNPQSAAEPAAKPKPAKKPRAAGELPWHPFWRAVVSLLVVLHLAAVFSAPWALQTKPALPPGLPPIQFVTQEELQRVPEQDVQLPIVPSALHRFFHHYLNLLYLNHGYEFFAPDPSATHVIDYRVTQPDGTVVEGRFPSHDEQWPRLLYHRHMMLAEQVDLLGPRSGQHYANHLATLYGGNSLLQRKVHQLLPARRVAAGDPADDPSTYLVVGEVTGQPRQPTEASNSASGEAPIAIPEGRQ